MRHTDPRLTEVTYMDQTLLPIADQLFAMPPIPNVADLPQQGIIQFRATGTDGTCDENGAGLMQESVGVSGQVGANQDISQPIDQTADSITVTATASAQVIDVAQAGTNEQGPAPVGTEPSSKRAMRFELTTFTLATCSDSVLSNADAGLTKGALVACTSACTSEAQNANETPADVHCGGHPEGITQGQAAAMPLEAIAQAIAGLSNDDRARLAAMFLQGSDEPAKSNNDGKGGDR